MSRSHHFHCHPEASSSESKIILIITLPYPVPGPPPLLCAILVALSRYPKYSEAAIEQTVAAFSAILTITKPSKYRPLSYPETLSVHTKESLLKRCIWKVCSSCQEPRNGILGFPFHELLEHLQPERPPYIWL